MRKRVHNPSFDMYSTSQKNGDVFVPFRAIQVARLQCTGNGYCLYSADRPALWTINERRAEITPPAHARICTTQLLSKLWYRSMRSGQRAHKPQPDGCYSLIRSGTNQEDDLPHTTRNHQEAQCKLLSSLLARGGGQVVNCTHKEASVTKPK